jgi:hypothetical protein
MALQPFVGPWPLFQFLDQSVAKPLPIQRTQTQNKHTQYTDIHSLSGIRTHDPSF